MGMIAQEFPCLDRPTHRHVYGSLKVCHFLNSSTEAHLRRSLPIDTGQICSTRSWKLLGCVYMSFRPHRGYDTIVRLELSCCLYISSVKLPATTWRERFLRGLHKFVFCILFWPIVSLDASILSYTTLGWFTEINAAWLFVFGIIFDFITSHW